MQQEGNDVLTERREGARNQWHLNKEVPISIILALVLQTVSGIWFISKLDSRVGSLEESRKTATSEQRERDEKQDSAVALVAAETQRRLDRIEEKLDRLIERSRR